MYTVAISCSIFSLVRWFELWVYTWSWMRRIHFFFALGVNYENNGQNTVNSHVRFIHNNSFFFAKVNSPSCQRGDTNFTPRLYSPHGHCWGLKFRTYESGVVHSRGNGVSHIRIVGVPGFLILVWIDRDISIGLVPWVGNCKLLHSCVHFYRLKINFTINHNLSLQ